MEEDKKYTLLLGSLYLANCLLLIIKYFPYSELMDFLGLIWPLFGVLALIEIIRGDRWGMGGIISQPFLFFCAIYFPIVVIINIISLSFSLEFLIDLSIGVIGIFQIFLYWD
jgi:hypothetical protein